MTGVIDPSDIQTTNHKVINSHNVLDLRKQKMYLKNKTMMNELQDTNYHSKFKTVKDMVLR